MLNLIAIILLIIVVIAFYVVINYFWFLLFTKTKEKYDRDNTSSGL